MMTLEQARAIVEQYAVDYGDAVDEALSFEDALDAMSGCLDLMTPEYVEAYHVVAAAVGHEA